MERPSTAALKEVAYYYPNATWRYHSTGFIKNLLLYFDGVGLLVPDYLKEKPFAQDPELASALRDNGLLHLLTPETVVTKLVTEKLAESVTEILATGALDHLSKDLGVFHELSYSRLGSYGDAGLAEMLFEEFLRRGLAKPSADGKSIPMHPLARSMVLVLLAQILRANSQPLGIALCPTTDRPDVLQALSELLNLPALPTSGQVLSSDLQHVGVDLTNVPIDQVLRFRSTHGTELQTYARDVRSFTRMLSQLPAEQRVDAFTDRKADIDAKGEDLARRAASYWKQPAAVYFTVLAATAGIAGNAVASGLLGIGGALAAFSTSGGSDGGAYSYLFGSRHLQA